MTLLRNEKLKLRHWWKILTFRDGQWRALAIFLEICFFGNPLEYCPYQWKRFCHIILSQKYLKCKILLGSLLIERQSSFWLFPFQLQKQLCETSPSPNWNSECRLSPLSLKGWWWIFYNSLFLRAGEEKVKDRHKLYIFFRVSAVLIVIRVEHRPLDVILINIKLSLFWCAKCIQLS